MGRVATTVAQLADGAYDGEQAVIILPSGFREPLIWNGTHWVGRARPTMRQVDNIGMSSPGNPSGWRYPGDHKEVPDPSVNGTAFGFQILKQLYAAEYFAAGLRLQEHLQAQLRVVDPAPGVPEMALAWYDLLPGADFLSPPPYNFGVHLVAERDEVSFRWASTGWQDSPAAAPPAGSHFYPELYLTGPAANFRNFFAQHRWIAGPAGGSVSPAVASKYPPIGSVAAWHVADDVPVADGGAVADWPDYSGRGRSLLQAAATKRPVVRRDGAGALRHVRFDGVNDLLRTGAPSLLIPQPCTVFMLMRQRAAGATQQAWLGPDSGNPALLYRGDATDQVNVWAGGTDLVYHRSSAWPSSWVVWTFLLDGANTKVWENGVQVAAGDAGGAGFQGITLANNVGETLPAAIDVAELIVSYKAATTGERQAVEAQLLAKAA